MSEYCKNCAAIAQERDDERASGNAMAQGLLEASLVLQRIVEEAEGYYEAKEMARAFLRGRASTPNPGVVK
jgi:hypothetical protein